MARKFSRPDPALPAAPAPALQRTVDYEALLTEDEKAEIRKKARAKVEARDKVAAEQAMLDAEMVRLDKEAHPEAFVEMVTHTVDLALYADRITLDGKVYVHGGTYDFTRSVYDVVREIESRTFVHDDQVHGNDPSDVAYRQQRNYRVNGRTGAVSSQGRNAAVRF